MGRQGQNQHGVDAVSFNGIYAQYKNYRTIGSKKQFMTRIQDDFSKAKKYFTDMEKFIVVTHLNRDISIQQEIKHLNNCIEILFWEDIENECYSFGEKHAKNVFGEIFELLCPILNKNNLENEFYNLFVDVKNELSEIDGYMIPLSLMEKINRLCIIIEQRRISLTFQYQPQLLQCYNDLMKIFSFFENTNIYHTRNEHFCIIDNTKVDFNQQEKIKYDFLQLKIVFLNNCKIFEEAIANHKF